MKGVHKYKNVWWFWDGQEKTKRRIGSYTSKVGAEVGMKIFKKDKEQEPHNLLFDENELTSSIDSQLNCSCVDEIEQCSHCSEMKYGL